LRRAAEVTSEIEPPAFSNMLYRLQMIAELSYPDFYSKWTTLSHLNTALEN
jgi:hypothetical protein